MNTYVRLRPLKAQSLEAIKSQAKAELAILLGMELILFVVCELAALEDGNDLALVGLTGLVLAPAIGLFLMDHYFSEFAELVIGADCERLLRWSEEYPEVEQFIAEIRQQNRPVLRRDYFDAQNWVRMKRSKRVADKNNEAYRKLNGMDA